MATNATIMYRDKDDDKIYWTYLHWDGYIEHTGKLLCQYYNSYDKAKELISYGFISSLGKRIGEKHNFRDLTDDCTFYHRDRGDEWSTCKYGVADDMRHMLYDCISNSIIYLYDDDRWLYRSIYDAVCKQTARIDGDRVEQIIFVPLESLLRERRIIE